MKIYFARKRGALGVASERIELLDDADFNEAQSSLEPLAVFDHGRDARRYESTIARFRLGYDGRFERRCRTPAPRDHEAEYQWHRRMISTCGPCGRTIDSECSAYNQEYHERSKRERDTLDAAWSARQERKHTLRAK